MPQGTLPAVGIANSVIDNVDGETRAILFVPDSVAQSIPSGPGVTDSGRLEPDSGTSVMDPEVVIRPSFPVPLSANQSLPSGPAAIP